MKQLSYAPRLLSAYQLVRRLLVVWEWLRIDCFRSPVAGAEPIRRLPANPCPACGAFVREPCLGPDGAALPEPHASRVDRLPGFLLEQTRMAASGCQAGRDGECRWQYCPQLRDGEPGKTGRPCPILREPEEG